MAPFRHLDSCFGCSTTNPSALGIAILSTPDGAEGRVRFGPDAEGAPGLVHGGLLATFADEVMGFVQHGGDGVRLTAEMTIRYRRPTPVDTELCCRARHAETDGRRLRVHAEITAADDDTTLLAEADAVFVVLDPAESARRAAVASKGAPTGLAPH